MNKKIDDMKSDYDTKLIKYKTDVDTLNLDNHRLRGIITKQERKYKRNNKNSKRVAQNFDGFQSSREPQRAVLEEDER